MTHPVINNFFNVLPPLNGGQRAVFALGAGIFGYQILAELVHNFAQEHFENWNVPPAYATSALTLLWVGFIASSSSALSVYFCFVATGTMAFAIYRSPFHLGSPPPSGLSDMIAEAQFHPEWEYCLPNETLVPLLETALKHPDKQSVMLLGDGAIGKTLQIEHLAWMLKNKKISQGSPLEKLRIFRWDGNETADLQGLARFFKNHPNAFLFIDTQPRQLLTFCSIQFAMGRGELRLIGTATPEVFKKDFAHDDISNGLWHQLPMNESNREQCIKVLEIKIPLLVKKYGPLSITKEALDTAVLLSKFIWPTLKQPVSAFDLLNRVCPHLIRNSATSSSESSVKIDEQAIIQGSIKAQLIDKDFELSLLQKGSSPPPGLLDMEVEAQSYPEWEYCLPNEELIPVFETTLNHPDKQSIMLLGDPGTGKTLQVEHLAWRLKFKKFPKNFSLEKVRIFKWDKYNLPQKIEEVLKYFKANPHAYLFIDKNHKFAGARDFEDNELIQSAMQRGELRIIGTATPEEYTKRFAPKDTLNRLWHQLPMNEPNRLQCAQILEIKLPSLIKKYGNFNITNGALFVVAALSKMIWPKLKHPDSAFDLLNRMCCYAVKNLAPSSLSGFVTIDIQEIIQGAKSAQLIEKDFDQNRLQLILNPPKQTSTSSTQNLLPSGLTDMVAEVEAHPEWAYGANADNLISKIVMAQAESWKKSILLSGHTTNTTLLMQNLCWRIKNKKIPNIGNLDKLKIVKLNPNRLMDDGTHSSDKKKDIEKIIEYLRNRPNTICIVENASFLVKRSSFLSDEDRGSTLAIKEALSDGKLKLVGTIKGDSVLIDKDDTTQTEKLWIVHQVPELTLLQCTELLMQAKEDIARRYSGIKIDEEAIKAAAILAEAFKANKSLWEMAYDLISQGCTQELLSKNTEHSLTKEDLISVVLVQKISNDHRQKITALVDKRLNNGLLNTGDEDDGVL
jgi:ATP-dependent Clp protease ATP-binding subunit ClpA